MSTQRVPSGVPAGGQFAATQHGESQVALDGADPSQGAAEPVTAPAGPRRLRSLAVVREDEAFLADMEAAEREVRARNVEKGDWVSLYGGDEYGVVKSVGLHTLTTDAWREEDTDEGDLVVAVVRKADADAILERHGALPARTVNTYFKRRDMAIELADRYEAERDPGARRALGHYELLGASRGVWLSAVQAGLAEQPGFDGVSMPDTLPEISRMERDYYDYNSMLRAAGHSDEAAARLVTSMRGAIAAIDDYYGQRPR